MQLVVCADILMLNALLAQAQQLVTQINQYSPLSHIQLSLSEADCRYGGARLHYQLYAYREDPEARRLSEQIARQEGMPAHVAQDRAIAGIHTAGSSVKIELLEHAPDFEPKRAVLVVMFSSARRSKGVAYDNIIYLDYAVANGETQPLLEIQTAAAEITELLRDFFSNDTSPTGPRESWKSLRWLSELPD